MIDFRYHLVSIAAIFLALAVGIVLGAGPLKGTIGDTLTSEVTKLRAEKDAMRVERDAAQKGVEARDRFILVMRDTIVRNQLQGRTVAVVTLPGADEGLVQTTVDTLVAANATIGSRVSIKSEWAEPGEVARTTHETAGGAALLALGGRPTETAEEAPSHDVALAVALLRPAADVVGDEPSPEQRAQAVAILEEADLISLQREGVTPSNAVIVIGPFEEAAPATAPETTDPAEAESTEALLGLVSELDRFGDGTVVAAALDETLAAAPGIVGSLRADAALNQSVSTVDDAGLAIGQASIVLATVEQIDGGVGHYGLARDASAVQPALPRQR